MPCSEERGGVAARSEAEQIPSWFTKATPGRAGFFTFVIVAHLTPASQRRLGAARYERISPVFSVATFRYQPHGLENQARFLAPDAHVVELRGLGAQAHFDIAQAFATGQLRKGHAQELVQAGEGLDLVLAAVARHAATKG